MKFLSRDAWRDCFDEILDAHVGPALRAGEMTFEDLADVIGEQQTMTLWGCAFEDFLTQEYDVAGVNIIDDYLKRRGWNEGAQAKAYMKALRNSVMSLYEVSQIIPGISFTARDLLRGGEPIVVSEGSATKTLAPWDKIGARIVTVMGKPIMAGGMLVFSDAGAKTLLASLSEVLGKGKGKRKTASPPVLTDDELGGVACLFTLMWLSSMFEAMTEARSALANMDGDEIMFHELRFPIVTGATSTDITARLNLVEGFIQEYDQFWNWLETAPEHHGKTRTRKRGASSTRSASHSFDTTMDSGARVLGNIVLDNDAVMLATNSSARAKRGDEIIRSALGDLVKIPVTQIRTVEQMMADRPAVGQDEASRKGIVGPELELEPEVVATLLHGHLEKHYRDTLDQPIGMLNGKTPRQAVRTATGKQLVAEWLKYLENQSAAFADPANMLPADDFGWMWDELGITDLRR